MTPVVFGFSGEKKRATRVRRQELGGVPTSMAPKRVWLRRDHLLGGLHRANMPMTLVEVALD